MWILQTKLSLVLREKLFFLYADITTAHGIYITMMMFLLLFLYIPYLFCCVLTTYNKDRMTMMMQMFTSPVLQTASYLIVFTLSGLLHSLLTSLVNYKDKVIINLLNIFK